MKEKMNVEVKYIGDIYEHKKDCLWYGGDVASITYKNAEFILAAKGCVIGTLYKDGSELRRFKDKRESGDFAHIINSYMPEVNTDSKLKALLNSDLSEDYINANKLSAIVLENNNWWEVFIMLDNEDTCHSYTIDFTDNLDEAVQSIINNAEEIYSNYCI